jgi:hypothetical protein
MMTEKSINPPGRLPSLAGTGPRVGDATYVQIGCYQTLKMSGRTAA